MVTLKPQKVLFSNTNNINNIKNIIKWDVVQLPLMGLLSTAD